MRISFNWLFKRSAKKKITDPSQDDQQNNTTPCPPETRLSGEYTINNGDTYSFDIEGYKGLMDNIKENAQGRFAFITKVKINNDVTVIPKMVFTSFMMLRVLELPDTLKTIKSGAFYSCNSMLKYHIPDSIECIESPAFPQHRDDVVVSVPYKQGLDFQLIGGEVFSIELRNIDVVLRAYFFNFIKRLSKVTEVDMPSEIINKIVDSFGVLQPSCKVKAKDFKEAGISCVFNEADYAMYKGCTQYNPEVFKKTLESIEASRKII